MFLSAYACSFVYFVCLFLFFIICLYQVGCICSKEVSPSKCPALLSCVPHLLGIRLSSPQTAVALDGSSKVYVSIYVCRFSAHGKAVVLPVFLLYEKVFFFFIFSSSQPQVAGNLHHCLYLFPIPVHD